MFHGKTHPDFWKDCFCNQRGQKHVCQHWCQWSCEWCDHVDFTYNIFFSSNSLLFSLLCTRVGSYACSRPLIRFAHGMHLASRDCISNWFLVHINLLLFFRFHHIRAIGILVERFWMESVLLSLSIHWSLPMRGKCKFTLFTLVCCWVNSDRVSFCCFVKYYSLKIEKNQQGNNPTVGYVWNQHCGNKG